VIRVRVGHEDALYRLEEIAGRGERDDEGVVRRGRVDARIDQGERFRLDQVGVDRPDWPWNWHSDPPDRKAFHGAHLPAGRSASLSESSYRFTAKRKC
jgi:hypothetical protein